MTVRIREFSDRDLPIMVRLVNRLSAKHTSFSLTMRKCSTRGFGKEN
jgi:hypothetical protein